MNRIIARLNKTTSITEIKSNYKYFFNDDNNLFLETYTEGNKLTEDVTTTDLAGTEYTTEEKTFFGYTLKEASELAKNANIYANVGDLEIGTATEHLISIMKAFNIEAENSIDVIDALNEVGRFCPNT